MPKERFLNLPPEKRERITQAAKAELARVPFEDMSINRVIHAAGIPRGSFYQYFEDKTDLLSYIMESYHNTMRENIRHTLRQSNGDLFRVFTSALHITIEFGTHQSNYAFCRNIFSHIHLTEENAFEHVRLTIYGFMSEFLPYVHLGNFRYTKEEDIATICEVVAMLLRRAISRIFADITRKDEIEKTFERELTMLKYGILKGEGTPSV